jgi:hypothetical protein
MKKLAVLMMIIASFCALVAVLNFAAGNYVTASIDVICVAINLWSFNNVRKVM